VKVENGKNSKIKYFFAGRKNHFEKVKDKSDNLFLTSLKSDCWGICKVCKFVIKAGKPGLAQDQSGLHRINDHLLFKLP